MKLIDKLGQEFPDVDVIKMQIILNHQEYPHFCLRELADLLCLSEASVQFHVQMMNERGKPGRNSMKLLTCSRDPDDRRRYIIRLNARGHDLANLINSLKEYEL